MGGSRNLTFLAIAFVASILCQFAFAGDIEWIGDPATPADWSDPANWSAGEPLADDNAAISNGGTAQITQVGEQADWLTLGAAGGLSGGVEMIGGDLTVNVLEISDVDWLTNRGRSTSYARNFITSDEITPGTADQFSFYFGAGEVCQVDLSAYAATGISLDELVDEVNTRWQAVTGGDSYVARAVFDATRAQWCLALANPNADGASLSIDGTNAVSPLADYANDFSQRSSNGEFEWIGGAASAGAVVVNPGGTLSLTMDTDINDLFNGNLTGGSVIGLERNEPGATQSTLKFMAGSSVTHDSGFVSLGRLWLNDSAYSLSGGELSVQHIEVGDVAPLVPGTFIHDGGTVDAGTLRVDRGQYELRDGDLTTHVLTLVGDGDDGGVAKFIQTGGTNTVDWLLRIEGPQGGEGAVFELVDGELTVMMMGVGYATDGTYIQRGGVCAAAGMAVGESGGTGVVVLDGGQLTVQQTIIGLHSHGEFIQTGGLADMAVLDVGGYLGDEDESGAYVLEGGSMSVGALRVNGRGTFNMHAATASATVETSLTVLPGSKLSAVKGATVHMTGADFVNHSVVSTDLDGLASLTMLFDGGADDTSLFEAAGQDFGDSLAGYVDNFALHQFQIGGEAGLGFVQLTDSYDNQSGWEGNDALYVGRLVLGAGSILDLDGLNLYYLGLEDLGGTILAGGGSLTHVWMPGDIDADGYVNATDLAILKANFGGAAGRDGGDFNDDGLVDATDLAIFKANFGSDVSDFTGGAPIPEPATMCLLVVGVAAALFRKRRP
ncbi:MAG: dockerin type I domain-containing protein [Planctomycetota bacterium]|jgi:hypothetical protein